MYLHMVICLLVSLVLEQVVLGADDVYLIYGRPGGRRGRAGLFGGNFKPNGPASDMNLEETRIDGASFESTYLNGFGVTGLSYDPVSKKALIQISDNLNTALAKLNPCINGRLRNDAFLCCKTSKTLTGPFALYNSDVYFVAQAWHLKDHSVTITLTVRKMTGCQDGSTFIMRNGYDNRNCSVEVAKVLEEVVFTDERLTAGWAEGIARDVRTVGSTLAVVKHENKLHFFVQVAKPLYTHSSKDPVREYSLRLYDAEEGREGRLLYVAPVPLKWSGYIITSIGDISYRDGLLCWSAFETIFCGKWNAGRNISEVHEVIKPGDAANVCIISSGRLSKYQNMLTGVAVASAQNKINIIFGCWDSWSNHGGAGYLTANNDWSNIQIKKISDRRGAINAGNLEIIDACPRPSRREAEMGFDAFL